MAKLVTKKEREPDVVAGLRDNLDDEENTKHVALFYGKAGRGKTHVASTFPKPMLYLNIYNEEGRKTIKGIEGITVADVETWDDFLDLSMWLQKQRDYETIVLDQITSLQDLGQLWMADKHRKSIEDLFGRWGKFWGELSGELKTALQGYRELRDRYNIVLLAHERVFDQDENADTNDLAPTVSARTMPSVGGFIEGACDIIGQCYIRQAKKKDEDGKLTRVAQYCMRVGPHQSYVTKIRRPVSAGPLPEFIVNPSYRKLIAIEAGTEDISTSKKRRE